MDILVLLTYVLVGILVSIGAGLTLSRLLQMLVSCLVDVSMMVLLNTVRLLKPASRREVSPCENIGVCYCFMMHQCTNKQMLGLNLSPERLAKLRFT